MIPPHIARSSIVGLFCMAAIFSPALAGDPPAPDATPAPASDTTPKSESARTAPAYETLYLAPHSDGGGPQAVVRTSARTEDEWMAIGRDLRARRPNFPVMVAIFISEHAPDLPEGYPDCATDVRQAFERWALGTYAYQARNYPYNETGDVLELVKQNIATPHKRTMNGVEVIELHEPNPTDIRNAPAAQRIVGVSVVVPGMKDEDLQRVAQAYEDEFGTPRLMQIVFFDAEPEWADKPYMTQDFFNFAERVYLRSSRAKNEELTEVLPLQPRWATLKDGEIVQK